MKAMQVVESGQGPALSAADVARPKPGRGQLLIRVYAAGVTTTELRWYPTTHKKTGEPRIGAVPGHEFSGVIAEIGDGAEGFSLGQEIYGMNDWFEEGATAEYCLTEPSSIALKPTSLTHAAAAVVPIGALTAWQGLLDRAKLQQGERVLVHGAAGGVGIFAVQLARIHGAHVIATASANTLALVKELGANEIIDYKAARFEQVIDPVDVVFDTVGGETRERSRSVLKHDGRIISIAADGEVTTDLQIRAAYFIVEPNHWQLVEVARLLDAGSMQAFVNAMVPLIDAGMAYAGTVQQKRGFGKIVVTIVGTDAQERTSPTPGRCQ
jgi:NADPH:quinone reductase-like Zn-dependent oxidoreductase